MKKLLFALLLLSLINPVTVGAKRAYSYNLPCHYAHGRIVDCYGEVYLTDFPIKTGTYLIQFDSRGTKSRLDDVPVKVVKKFYK